MTPAHYFYLVNLDEDLIEAIFTADHIGDGAEMAQFERNLRAKCGVDADPALELRNSRDNPLKDHVWAGLSWKRASE